MPAVTTNTGPGGEKLLEVKVLEAAAEAKATAS